MTNLRRRRAAAALRLAVVASLLAVLTVLTVLTTPTAPPATAGEPGSTPFLQIRVDRVTPELVTTTSEAVVAVAGTVTNVGNRPVREVVVRLERAPAVTSSEGLRTNLDGVHDQYQGVGDFITVSPELQRGQNATFTLSLPIRSANRPALDIDAPGVYPLLVNVNGTPDYGEPARLDDARFLLPVLGVPPDPTVASADTLTAVVAPDTAKPLQVTMLWPLASRPKLAPGAPGGTTPVRLVDDQLAQSVADGGRLDTLLIAAEFATSQPVDPDGAVGRSLCLAVDPDLLVTVNAMTAGYVVSDSPDPAAQRPGGPTHPGAGQAAAVAWLDRLRALAGRMCVAPTPYAQADLNALQRVGDRGLSTIATEDAGGIVEKILGVTSTPGATLVGDGSLTGRAVALLDAQDPTVAIAAAGSAASVGSGPQDSSPTGLATADVTPRRVSPKVAVAPFDPTVGAALAAAGRDPAKPTYLDASLRVPLNHDSETARRQNALGSMLWRALAPSAEPRTQILMPPLVWNLTPHDAQSILTALASTIRSGLAAPRPLTTVIAESQSVSGKPQPVTKSHGTAPGAFDDAVISEIADSVGRLWGLTAALTTDPRTGLTGLRYTAPLREDMLRALSQSEPPNTRNGLARQRLAVVSNTITDLFAAVTIVNPGGSYTLATERSPLPLALRNDLAVPIRVRLQVDAPPGMTVTDLGEIELPPGYLPLRVPLEVHFTQRVAVDVSLRTPDGLALGEPVRFSVHSNAYGKVLFAITLTAAAALMALTARRLWHRFRGQPDRADLDRPDPPLRHRPGEK